MNVELNPTLHHLIKLLWWEKSLFKGWVVHSFIFFPIGQSHSLHSTFSCGIFSCSATSIASVWALVQVCSLTLFLKSDSLVLLLPETRHLRFKVHHFSWKWYTLLFGDPKVAHTVTQQTSWLVAAGVCDGVCWFNDSLTSWTRAFPCDLLTLLLSLIKWLPCWEQDLSNDQKP